MKQVLLKRGKTVVDEVPVPQVSADTVLVQVHYSCISVGTELSGLERSGQPLWKLALRYPEQVKKVFQFASTHGLSKARSVVESRLSMGTPIGYSAAGVVIAVGDHVRDVSVGDRVACAGAQCAHHAEFIQVPRNLVVSIPEAVAFSEASTVTLGAIALQGVRRAAPTLGETVFVVGLGILGQLTVQLLKANGCRVIGSDLDPQRIEQAKKLGMDFGLSPEEDDSEQTWRLTHGIGVDAVIITAATRTDQVLSTAFKACRKKGRVVVVGDVGLNIQRSDIYTKELDFFISTSYGPGRYDETYEEHGLDYPVGYVRWTENRNMSAYLQLLAEQRLHVQPLISATYPIQEAPTAFAALQSKEHARPLLVLLEYPQEKADSSSLTIPNPRAKNAKSGSVSLAVVGAGGFAKAMHLPNIQQMPAYHLRAVVSRSGHNAATTATQFGAVYSTTDYQQVLADPEIQAVLIATRHDQHANMVLQALRAGKSVLVEKPLALTHAELDEIRDFYTQQTACFPVLLTGFNRRFSPYLQRMAELVKYRSNPLMINYRMNAGYIPLDHWVHTAEGGGRNLGEACHIYDIFVFLTNSQAVAINAYSIKPKTGFYEKRDNFSAQIRFTDGSVANLIYTAAGSKDYPKEQMDVFVDGKVITLDDYRSLTVTGVKAKGVRTRLVEKGQREELVAFANAVQSGGEWPIPLWQQLAASQIALQVNEQLVAE